MSGGNMQQRKRLEILLVLVLAVSLLASPALEGASYGAGGAGTGLLPAAAEITVYINDQRLDLEDPPVIQEGRTLVPMRSFFEALGAEVEWDEETRTAVGTRDEVEVRIPIDSTSPTVNGEVREIEVPAQIFNGRTYIPLRFVGEALGDEVKWDGEARRIDIKSSEDPAADPPDPPLADPVYEPGADPGDEAGSRTLPRLDDVTYAMVYVPGGTFPYRTSGYGENVEVVETATVGHAFLLSETEVTYELWYTVRVWAEANGYAFENKGREGSTSVVRGGREDGAPPETSNEPVTCISWRDAVVWVNALSEMAGHSPVYRTAAGDILRDSTGPREGGHPVDEAVQTAANGYRLPTCHEWELAARWQGRDSSHGALECPEDSGYYWTPGHYASGATDTSQNEAASTEVAWYLQNSRSNGNTDSRPVAQLKPNYLGLYDMSGNVAEFTFDECGDPAPDHLDPMVGVRGGSHDSRHITLRPETRGNTWTYASQSIYGLRLAR